MRTMYDTASVPATMIPADAEIVAGYVDGHYRSYDAVVARCPHAVHVPIAVFASTRAGVVLDCEAGDATPAQAPSWVAERRAAGVWRPTVYCPISDANAVKAALSAAGQRLHQTWDLWVAHYDDSTAPAGIGEAAKQYIDHGPHGENYDMSAVYDPDWPHVSPPPPPARRQRGGFVQAGNSTRR